MIWTLITAMLSLLFIGMYLNPPGWHAPDPYKLQFVEENCRFSLDFAKSTVEDVDEFIQAYENTTLGNRILSWSKDNRDLLVSRGNRTNIRYIPPLTQNLFVLHYATGEITLRINAGGCSPAELGRLELCYDGTPLGKKFHDAIGWTIKRQTRRDSLISKLESLVSAEIDLAGMPEHELETLANTLRNRR